MKNKTYKQKKTGGRLKFVAPEGEKTTFPALTLGLHPLHSFFFLREKLVIGTLLEEP